MAMDENYTRGFGVVNQLEDTLLNYVMQNRQMQEQARQFNRAQELRDMQFAENKRRFNIGEERDMRYETLEKDTRRANRAMFENLASYNKQRKLQEDYDRRKNQFINARESNPLSFIDSLNVFDEYATAKDRYAADFEKATGARPEPTMAPLPQFGTTRDVMPTVGTQQYLQYLDRNPNNLLKIVGG